MGLVISTFLRLLSPNKDYKVAIIGLDNAGKTTILYRMKLGKVVQTHPTIGTNVETVKHGRLVFNCWDLGGQGQFREMWRHYFGGTDAVIMVVDSTDRERVQLARQELHRALDTDVLQGAHLLLLANKQDLRDAMGPGQLSTELALTDIRGRQWRIQGSSAVTGEGLKEGLDWLAQQLGEESADGAAPSYQQVDTGDGD